MFYKTELLLTKKLSKMKKIEKLKLNQLNKVEMNLRQQNALKGGGGCICVSCLCPYDDSFSMMSFTEDGPAVQNTNMASYISYKKKGKKIFPFFNF